MLQALPGLLGLVVLVTQLGLVDGEGLLLVGEGRPEVSHAALCPGHQVVAHRHLQGLHPVVLDVQLQGLLQEPQADVVLAHGVEDQADVGVDEGQLRVVLPGDEKGQVASSVEQLQGGGDLCVGEAVEGEVGVLGDRVGVVDS